MTFPHSSPLPPVVCFSPSSPFILAMTYDPFLPEVQTNEKFRNTLLSVRRPAILDDRLSHLEWHTNVPNRKRPRTTESSQISSGHLRNKRPGGGGGTESSQFNAHAQPTSAAPNTQDVSPSAFDRRQQQPHSSHQRIPASVQPNSKNKDKTAEEATPILNDAITIMGEPPLVDDRVRQLVQFILRHVNSRHIEIEAKLGVLIEKDQSVRVISLVPVLCETPIREESNGDVRFVSNVGEQLFLKVNKCLNARVEKSRGAVRYVRTRETDVYYPGRIRETRVQSSNSTSRDDYKVVKTQRKTRLGDQNVLSPGSLCDIRYSASREEDCSAPPNTKPEMQREKDRISYKYDYVSVDITNVETINRSGGIERSHEVEVEIDCSTNLFEEVEKYRRRDDTSKLFDIAHSVVNTVRLLLEL